MLSNKFIILPLALFNNNQDLWIKISDLRLICFGIINISAPSISHSFFPLANKIVSICNNSSSKSIPLVINVLPFINTVFTFSSQSRTCQLIIFRIIIRTGKLSVYSSVIWTLLELNRCINWRLSVLYNINHFNRP